ncbi:MAG: 50S ribosomal protein L31 [Geminicoccales bacterium]
MRTGIHPEYKDATITCVSCGTTWETRSTKPEIRVELCSTCHPFYTGKQRIVDTAGQVERFMNRLERAEDSPRRKKAERRRQRLEQRRRMRSQEEQLLVISGEADEPEMNGDSAAPGTTSSPND